ncbi:MAG: hypothetical protein HYW71_00805 [Candidatus Niyogibacteria bacterium]|nr:hypothetical protein [Candidatus Niyogibacteria bacterium]
MRKIILLAILIKVFFLFLVLSAFGAKLPDKAVTDYYSLKEYQLLKTEIFSAVPWISVEIFTAGFKAEQEKITLVKDMRENRIMAVYHQKTDDQKIEIVGCHADLDYLEMMRKGQPSWMTFESEHCREEISNFLHIFGKIYQKKYGKE